MIVRSLKSRVLMGSALAAVLFAAPSAFAQTADGSQVADPQEADQVDEIVVTGIRGSLRASIEQKRDADNIVEVITATDIGKLPDENVADSLQRVTGVQISREGGEGRSANIRGLAATTYINGRSAASPGRTRDFDLRNLTADFFEAVEVSKSVLASQPEGTLGGSINLVTRKPLSFSDRTLSAGLEATYSDYSEQWDPRGTFFIADRITDNFGASFGVSYSRRSIRQDAAFNQGGMQIGIAPGVTGFDFNRDGVRNDYIRPNDYRFSTQLTERERIGGDITLQWRPTDDVTLRLDGTAARLVNDTTSAFMSVANGFATANASNIVLDSNGFLQSGTFRNSAVNVDGRYAPEVLNTHTFGFNGQWTPGNWTVTLDASTSAGDYQEVAQILRFGGPLATVNVRPTGDSSPYNVEILTAAGAPYDFFLETQFLPNLTFDRVTLARQRNNIVTLDGMYQFDDGFFDNVKFGVRASDFLFTASEANIGNEFNDTTNPAFYRNGVRLNASQSPFSGIVTRNFPSEGGFFAGESGSFPREWLTTVYTGQNVEAGSRNWRNLLNFNTRRAVLPLSVARVEEQTQGIWATTDIDTELFGLRVRANVGVRVVQTDLTSSGFDAQSRPISVENSYTDTLPAGNVRIDLSEDLVFRFAAAKILQRADLADLTTSFNVIPGGGTASIGNPNLLPYEATNYDAALEWYFSEDGLLSGTIFYKDVTNFLISQTTLAEIPGYVPLNRPPGDPLGNQFFITQRINGSGATIQGIELSYQQPFTFLPVEGFGTVLNYTYSDAETTTGAPYEGLSEHTFNVIAYYENGPVNARLAYNYKSESAQTVGLNINSNSLGSGVAADGRPIGLYQYLIPQGFLDASFSYQINDDVRFVVEGINLTDQQSVLYVNDRSTVNEVIKTDRRVTVGVKMTF
ncbi:Vitamin B12 transporter BtuB [Brevundimonas sp. NIBR11]|nr:Vitamin B12 transporter BtuB [Brevundimonas sp. NIBR11]